MMKGCVGTLLVLFLIQRKEVSAQISTGLPDVPTGSTTSLSTIINSPSYTDDQITEVLLNGSCHLKSNDSDLCLNMECFPCSQESCNMGTCCLHELTDSTRDAGKYTGCMQNGTVGIVRCPDDWPVDDHVRLACENGTGRFTPDEPVSDLTTNVTYRNKDCAACHGVEEFVSWRHNVSCESFQHVYVAESEEEYLERASRPQSTCGISFAAPENVLTQGCNSTLKKWYPPEVIASCNVTGEWQRYDARVAEVCSRYEALSLRVRHRTGSKKVYQNVFCAECNGITAEFVSCTLTNEYMRPGHASHIVPKPSLSLLLGLHDHSEQQNGPKTTSNCSVGTWQDLEGLCRNLTCTEGKVLSPENGTCNTAVSVIRGLAYDLHITLVAMSPASLPDTEPAWTSFQKDFSRTLKAKLHPSDYIQLKVSPSFKVSSGKVSVNALEVRGWALSNNSKTRDELESSWVENILTDWVVVDVESNTTAIFKFVHGGRILNEQFSGISLPFTFNINKRGSRRYGYPEGLNIPLTPILTCPAVTFPASEFGVEPSQGVGGSLKVHLKFEGYDVELPNIHRVEIRNDTIQVCVQVLEEVFGRFQGRFAGTEGYPLWEYVVNMTVIPLSILALLLILIVYSMLPPLRNLPGLNMMGTCCTLMLAQLFLLLAVHRPVEGTWCVALGVLVHVLWLSTFCWTLVSSCHMFRTFSSSTPAARGGRLLQPCLNNVGFTLLVPCLIVAVVVVESFSTSQGRSIGYSPSICFLSSPWLVGFSVVLPLSVIVIVNVVLFILTVRRIQQVVGLQARAGNEADRHHVKACFRLSLLTGATWIVSLLAGGLDLPWLRLVSVFVNGGQGALLFLSYVTTRRVLSMLAVKLGCRPWKEESRASASPAVGTACKTPVSNQSSTTGTGSAS